MQQNNQSKKVLLKITDLKQWFPIKKTKLFQKEQLYVRANDGITLDIYEGETVGLVGESGCGKSTFGRTLLQLYPQTEGKTMYYGRTLWEMAPDYVEHTVKNIVSRKKKIRELEQKTREMRAEYEKMADGAEKFKKQETCEKVRKECNREFLDLVQIIGGFYAIESTQEAEHMILNQFKIAKELRELKEDHEKKGREKEIGEKERQLRDAMEKMDTLRKAYSKDDAFQKYEEYRDDGVDLARLKANEMRVLRKDMQMIFQDPYSSINPRMTVSEIIGEPLKIFKICSLAADYDREVAKLMDTVGLAGRLYNTYPHELDGGRRQRIGIARALALNPKFIVCDEPVSALDVSIQAQILNLMQDLQEERGLTYIFITHDLSVVKHISDHIGVMYLGQMVEMCESKELFRNQLHPYTKALLSAIPRPKIHQKTERILLRGEITSPINPGEKCRFCSRCIYAQERCSTSSPRLADAGNGHSVACHYWREIAEGSLKAQEAV